MSAFRSPNPIISLFSGRFCLNNTNNKEISSKQRYNAFSLEIIFLLFFEKVKMSIKTRGVDMTIQYAFVILVAFEHRKLFWIRVCKCFVLLVSECYTKHWAQWRSTHLFWRPVLLLRGRKSYLQSMGSPLAIGSLRKPRRLRERRSTKD